MSAATQAEMGRLRATSDELSAWLEGARNAATQYKIERDEHEQARTALEKDLGQVVLERDEAFARGRQAFEELRRVESELDAAVNRFMGLEKMIADGPVPSGKFAYVANSIRKRVDRERLEWKQQAEAESIVAGSYRDERDDALEREQALAAQLERIQERARLITDRRHWEGDADPRVPHVLLDKLSDACMDTPATSLARLKAKAAVEALEEEAREWPADKYTECSHVRESILQSAGQLRRQAEGDNHE